MEFYLETERLILREIKESDIDGMFELDTNIQVHAYLGNNPIKTKEQAAQNIQFIRTQYLARGIGRFAVIEKKSNEFIGWCGLKLCKGKEEELNGVSNFIDIGYRLIPKFWGKGYASEAAIASLDFGFKTMKYECIYGAAEVANIGSNKVLQKIGLHFISEFNYKEIKANWYQLNKSDYEW
jgi:ribosomal-protein-alanine N-acetyltransferase